MYMHPCTRVEKIKIKYVSVSDQPAFLYMHPCTNPGGKSAGWRNELAEGEVGVARRRDPNLLCMHPSN